MHEPEKLTPSDLLKAGDSEAEAFLPLLASYFSVFAKPVFNDDGEPVCLNCDKRISAFAQQFGLGVAWQWGIVHGEARCSGCGWPGRGMHYIKDEKGEELLTLRNVFLAYHPDNVTSKEQSDAQ